MNLNVDVSMSLGHVSEQSGRSYDEWAIRVVDKASGAMVVEVRMTPDQMGRAIAAHYLGVGEDIPCDVGNPALWGAEHQHRTETVYPDDLHDPDSVARAAAVLETDGWRARVDFRNIHRRSIDGGYTVHLSRFVRDGQPVSLEDR